MKWQPLLFLLLLSMLLSFTCSKRFGNFGSGTITFLEFINCIYIPLGNPGSRFYVMWDHSVLEFFSVFFFFPGKSPFHREALVLLSMGEASCSIRRSHWSWKSRLLPGLNETVHSFSLFLHLSRGTFLLDAIRHDHPSPFPTHHV